MVTAPRMLIDPAKIMPIGSRLPWKATDLGVRPFVGMWSFNPSIHFDGDRWLCVLRCADYAMPDGVTIRSEGAHPIRVLTKNALVELDPSSWRVTTMYEMRERDGLARVATCTNVGYEDVRLFRTDRGGLQGIAASLHLARSKGDQRNVTVPPEQVLISFDDRYNVVEALPLRGTWSGNAQKNWAPFDGAEEPRFLYSIARGTVHDVNGPVRGSSAGASLIDPQPKVPSHGGTEVKLRGRALAVTAGQAEPPSYDGLRGGSQLLHVGGDRWLGVGHEMRFVNSAKFYYHSFFLFDAKRDAVVSRSEPMKLHAAGIEFAAGMAIDGDRVVVSFGTDDMNCHIGETDLGALLDALEPTEIA